MILLPDNKQRNTRSWIVVAALLCAAFLFVLAKYVSYAPNTESEPAQGDALEAEGPSGWIALKPAASPGEAERLKVQSDALGTSLGILVYSGADATPVAGVTVRIRPVSAARLVGERTLITDAAGMCLLEPCVPGDFWVSAAGQPEMHVQVPVGEHANAQYEVIDSGVIQCRVVGPGGAGVGGAAIWLSKPGMAYDGVVIGSTDGDGRFSMLHVAAGVYVGALHPEWGPSYLLEIEERHRDSEALLVLREQSGRVEGQVMHPDGTAAAGACVVIGSESQPPSKVINGLAVLVAPGQVLYCNEDGHFRSSGIEPGRLPVVVRAAVGSPWVGTVTVRAQRTESMEIHLNASFTISGTAMLLGGSPLAGAIITEGNTNSLSGHVTIADAMGRYQLRGLSRTEVQLKCYKEGVGRTSALVDAQTGTWNPIITPDAVVEGAIVGCRGAGLIIHVGWEDGKTPRKHAVVVEEGRFRVRIPSERARDLCTVVVWSPSHPQAFPLTTVKNVDPRSWLDIAVASRATEGGIAMDIVAPHLGGTVLNAHVTQLASGRISVRAVALDKEGEGKLDVRNLPPGEFSIELRNLKGFRIARHATRIGNMDVSKRTLWRIDR